MVNDNINAIIRNVNVSELFWEIKITILIKPSVFKYVLFVVIISHFLCSTLFFSFIFYCEKKFLNTN